MRGRIGMGVRVCASVTTVMGSSRGGWMNRDHLQRGSSGIRRIGPMGGLLLTSQLSSQQVRGSADDPPAEVKPA